MQHAIKLDNIKIDRISLLNLTRLFAYEPGTVLLYSGGNYECAAQSILFLFPYEQVFIGKEKMIRKRLSEESLRESLAPNPWDALKELIGELKGEKKSPEWVGYLTYEMGATSDQEKELALPEASIPSAFFQRCALTLVVDHQTDESTLWIANKAIYYLTENQKKWVERLSQPKNWAELVMDRRDYSTQMQQVYSAKLMQPPESYKSYEEKILKAKELILAGTIYQINLSQQFIYAGTFDSYGMFYRLSLLNPAPFAAYINLSEFSIVSSSPERFLKKLDNKLESRPIKGTAPRGTTPELDALNRQALLASEKERAELLMITDLTRHDLGKVSLPGSVEAVNLWECESYSNVFHLSSTIRSEAIPTLHSIDLVRACFPGGSITGCPKLSAMEVIAALENRSRGIYTGAIGYFADNGNFDFNIAIRTILISEDATSVQLGGGIVADSDPRKEYEETLHKGQSIFQALEVNQPGE